MRHSLLKALWLPIEWYLVDVFSSECHLLPVGQSNVIPQPVSILRHAPVCAILDFGDIEVYGFGCALLVFDDCSDHTARVKVSRDLTWENLAGPVGGLVHDDRTNCTRHAVRAKSFLEPIILLGCRVVEVSRLELRRAFDGRSRE